MMSVASSSRNDASKEPGIARMVNAILRRETKIKLIIAAAVAGLLALMETAAIVTVLPLVNIATGAPIDEGAIGVVWRIVGEPSRSAFTLLLVGAVVGLFIVKDICAMAFNWWQSGFVAQERVRLSVRIFRTVMRSPYAQFRRRSIGEVYRTMTTAVGVTFSSVINGLIILVSGGLTVIAIAVALLVATPLQAVVALVYFGVASLLYVRIVRPRVSRAGEAMMSGSVEATIAGLQGLNGFKEVKLRHSSEYFVGRFEHGVASVEQASREGNYYGAVTKYILEILFIVGVGLVMVMSLSYDSGAGAIGSLALFVAAGFRLLPNISMLVGAVNGFRLGRESLKIVYSELQAIGAGEDVERRADATPFARDITLDGVRFSYADAADEVGKGVDLTFPLGRSDAFVGGSGAGKTTLVDLVLGLLEPTAGTIRVDGRDISDDVPGWQQNVAMVAQDVYLTEESVRQNILFDVPVEDEDGAVLATAMERAQLSDVIVQLPEGLESSAGEWGTRLSGGQRQRVGIARALYLEPKLLVLDEATSALDNETERRITETIESLSGEVTVIIVAHRLSTIKNVDMVVFLKDGEIAGRGSFADLQRSNDDFARLVRLGDLSGDADG